MSNIPCKHLASATIRIYNTSVRDIALNLTQTQLAEKINTKQKSISRYETGASLPSIRTLVKIAKVLKKGADYSLDEWRGCVSNFPQDDSNKELQFDASCRILHKEVLGKIRQFGEYRRNSTVVSSWPRFLKSFLRKNSKGGWAARQIKSQNRILVSLLLRSTPLWRT